jgi:hypothetical protein
MRRQGVLGHIFLGGVSQRRVSFQMDADAGFLVGWVGTHEGSVCSPDVLADTPLNLFHSVTRVASTLESLELLECVELNVYTQTEESRKMSTVSRIQSTNQPTTHTQPTVYRCNTCYCSSVERPSCTMAH